VRPWLENTGLWPRAARVALVMATLTSSVLPLMVLYFGADGWWWDNTLAVGLLMPVGIVIFDELAEAAGRLRGRPIRGMARAAVLIAGLVAGNFAGYLLTLAVWPLPGRTPHVVFADFRRNMSIFVPILSLLSVAVASFWHRAETYRLESAALRASFKVLERQMQPHFLFNALNALKELIPDDPALARAFTQRLADLYRLILKVSTTPTTPLADELTIVGHYLEVERIRYGERLRYSIEVPDELLSLHVPSLMLQTLAENAVKHGIAKARAGGEVRIGGRRLEDGELELEIANTGAPFATRASDQSGTGLENTRARLNLMYGGAGRLSISSDPERGTLVRCVVSGDTIG
jgi:hypothetical protein